MTYANPDALVTTDWLKANLSDPNIRIIEVDEDATVYEKGPHPRGRSPGAGPTTSTTRHGVTISTRRVSASCCPWPGWVPTRR